MKVKTTHYIIALLLLIVGQAGAQTKLEGRVLDSQTDEPIIGATVAVVDEHSGVLTDMDGNFSVTVRNLPAVIKVSFVGYRELQVDVYDASEPIVIPLTEAASSVMVHFVPVGSVGPLTGVPLAGRGSWPVVAAGSSQVYVTWKTSVLVPV